MKKILIATAALGSLMAGQSAYAGCSTEPYIGSVCATATTYCPSPEYEEARGQLLAISDNSALYSLIGTRYGGDARSTFALPDLRGRAPIGQGTGPGMPTYQLAERVGQIETVLTVPQLPAHNHPAQLNSSGATATGQVNLPVSGSVNVASSASSSPSTTPSDKSVLGKVGFPSAALYNTPGTNADLQIGPDDAVSGTASGSVSLNVNSTGSVVVGNTGTNMPVKVVGPRLAMTYCIAVRGQYPSRP